MAVKNASISTIIQKTRKQAGLTQKQLADLADVGKTLIFDLENGHQSIHFDKLQRICRVLNIKITLAPPQIKE